VSVTVAELQGKLRFGLRHFPSPHWFVSFVEEPTIQFEVESVFEGATVPQLSMLIVNQIRRSVRNHFTLPAARPRYQPLFRQPTQDVALNVDINGKGLHEGRVSVRFVGVWNLKGARAGSHLYCELSNEQSNEDMDAADDGSVRSAQQATRMVQFEVDKSKGEDVEVTFVSRPVHERQNTKIRGVGALLAFVSSSTRTMHPHGVYVWMGKRNRIDRRSRVIERPLLTLGRSGTRLAR